MPSAGQFPTIITQGGLVPAELLGLLAQRPDEVSGTSADQYHLPPGLRLRDAINRSWTDLQGAWATFGTELTQLPQDGRATSITRERWLLPLMAELGYGRLTREPERMVARKSYPISHGWGPVPIHLLGADVDLDHRTKGVAGAAAAAPHSMVQEYLNRSADSLWGILSNGRRLRVLRDNSSLTRAAYLEFDLEAMFEGMVFTDFALLWLVCHQSRFEPLEGDLASSCWLERWLVEAQAQGVRALDTLRSGFKEAITALGSGFLAHPANAELRERLRTGSLSTQDYYRQVLRVIYRFVFLLVAEDRDLLLAPDASGEARAQYHGYYSMGALRDLARRHRGGRHGDLWEARRPVFAALDHAGLAALGLPALGSFLWSADACRDLDRAQLANRDLLGAIRNLGYVERNHQLHRVDFVNLGPEELGSIYESLLELHPRLEADAGRFSLIEAAGSERKTSGSYYTPTSLITKLLETALDPVLDETARAADAEEAILELKVVDPACGSGHFLIAAGHRIATRLASVRTGELSPPPSAVRHALREVVGRCLYGIDVNPMALELAKVNLWLEAVEPGRPLSFVDHHLVCGNALLGATPSLLAEGIPDEAFAPLTGDDKDVVRSLKRQNHEERAGRQGLFGVELRVRGSSITAEAAEVSAFGDETLADRDAKEARWNQLLASDSYRNAVFAADLWASAFVTPKHKGSLAITQALFEAANSNPERIDVRVREVVGKLAEQYRFLHWHLAFPDVYDEEGNGGFDVALGNPPWEQIQYDPREAFAASYPAIAAAPNLAARLRLLDAMAADDEAAYNLHLSAKRELEGIQHFLHSAGRFPLTSFGRLNTAPLFVEAMRAATNPKGRAGVIVPTGIATDSFNQYFFTDCVDNQRLVSLYDFENAAPLFPSVHRSFKFCLLTLGGAEAKVREAEFSFFAHQVSDLDDPERRFALTPEDFALINPNTRTAPVFRSRRDAELTKKIYRRVPVLIREGDPDGNPWGVEFQLMFMMNTDSHLFRQASELGAEGAVLEGNVWVRGKERWLPLYEAKMVHHFNHRWGDFAMQADGSGDSNLPDVPVQRLEDPDFAVQPRYWVAEAVVAKQLPSARPNWLLGFRNVCRATDVRTMISTLLPVCAVGNSEPIVFSEMHLHGILSAILNSFVCDFAVRQKLGGTNLNFFIVKQLPVLPPNALQAPCPWSGEEATAAWLLPRVLELTFTAWDVEGFARHLGYNGAPFRWDTERRTLLRAEIDAACFHLYGLDRDEVDYVMETFPIVRRKDEADYGEYRTKRLILERYDAMTEAAKTGQAYVTALVPGPADPACAHEAGGDG